MDDRVGVSDEGTDERLVSNVAANELRAADCSRVARREVVEDDDGVTVTSEAAHDMGADVAAASGDQDVRRRMVPASLPALRRRPPDQGTTAKRPPSPPRRGMPLPI
jgi:hypothetical protein